MFFDGDKSVAIALEVWKIKGRSQPPSTPQLEAEIVPAFDFTDTDGIQSLLKTRAYSKKMGFRVNRAIFAAFDQARANYIQAVGSLNYLAQMLDSFADDPAHSCRFFVAHQPHILIKLAGDQAQPIKTLVDEHFQQGSLFLKVEVRDKVENRVVVRYV